MLGFSEFMNKIISFLIAFFTLLPVTVPAIIKENEERIELDRQAQIEYIEFLESFYANEEFMPVNENSFCDFDYDGLKSEIRLNEISFIATHNSYQLQCVDSYKAMMNFLNAASFGLINSEVTNFESDTLTEQFNLGIRSIELDIETVVSEDEVSFVCVHSPIFDSTTTCYDFSLALKEIKLWSDANPKHLPITVIIEPKKAFIPHDGMKLMKADYLNELDKLLRSTFGEKLLTPADMMGEYASLKEMREANAWKTLEACEGRVMFLLHPTGIASDKYISQDESIKTQAMFPMLRYADRDKDYASFVLMNKPKKAASSREELLKEKELFVRTRVDTYGSYSDENLANAFLSGSQLMSTDYPVKKNSEGAEHTVAFGNGKTVSLSK